MKNHHLKTIRRLFQKEKPILLGRWGKTEHGRKAELANHDNCGGDQCSKTALTSHSSHDNSFDVALCALHSFQMYGTKK